MVAFFDLSFKLPLKAKLVFWLAMNGKVPIWDKMITFLSIGPNRCLLWHDASESISDSEASRLRINMSRMCFIILSNDEASRLIFLDNKWFECWTVQATNQKLANLFTHLQSHKKLDYKMVLKFVLGMG